MEADPVTGKQLDRYKIEARVGQGGMGVVYRAWDVQLRRRVALKILESDADRLNETRLRLLAEARSIAALNHPNIVTVYDIGHTQSLAYVAMEFVEGQTLHAVIGNKPLPLDLALRYGVQIADAVAAAHAAAVLHRDLKPANVMIDDHGRVKVLDFGLAKVEEQTDQSSDTRTMLALTQKGMAVGTPRYMSPEQAQGKPLDARSDIFSLGTILYEMLTGNCAFAGDSLAAVLAAILMVEPPPISSIRQIPPELENLVAACLRKEVAARVQTAGEVRDALQIVARNEDTASWLPGVSQSSPILHPSGAVAAATAPAGITAASSPIHRRRWPWLVAAAAAASLVVAGVWYFQKRPPGNPFAGTELFRLTSDAGLTWQPTLSRDGKLIAYASDRGNSSNLQIWVQQVAGGAPIQITSGDAESSEPNFSPDGSQIVFRSERDGGGIFLVPALGGESRLIARGGYHPHFSPDGRQIAYCTAESSYLGKILLIDLSGNLQPRPFHPEFPSADAPVWSPDGKSILFNASRSRPDGSKESDWFIAAVAGGDAKPTGGFQGMRKLGFQLAQDPAAWLPGDRLLIAAIRGSANSLWLLDLPHAGRPLVYPARLTLGTSTDQDPVFSGDTPATMQVAFASVEKHVDLWEAPLDASRGVVTGPMSRLTESRGSQSNQLTASSDGNRIAFLSNRSGHSSPWILDMNTRYSASVTAPGVIWTPRISPDGKSLAWSVFDEKGGGLITKIMRAPVDENGHAGIPETLCDRCGAIASWSPDGRIITYGYGHPNRAAALELNGGIRYDLLVKPDTDVWGADFSPDGRWLTMSTSQIEVAPFDPQSRQAIPFDRWIAITSNQWPDGKPRWAPDGKSIYFVSERDGFRCIWRQPLDPSTKRPKGAPTAVMHFHQARLSLRNVDMGPLAIQVTKKRLIFSLGEVTGNVWLLRRSRTE